MMLAAFLLLAILTVGAVSASGDADNMSSAESYDSIESGVDEVIAVDGSDGNDELSSDEYPEVGITTRVNYDYRDVSIVEYNFPENATGYISVFIDESDGPSYYSEVVTGKDVEIFADDLKGFEFKPGVYIINVTYSGNENYGEENWNNVLTITEEEDIVSGGPDVDITTLIYYEDTDEPIVSYYFPEDATGSISISINEKESYSSEITTDRRVSIYADNLEGFEFVPGLYDIVVRYPGNENYGIYEWEATLQITDEKDDSDDDYDPDFNITFTEYYNSTQNVIKGRGTYDARFEFPLIAEGTVTVYVDNKRYSVKEIDLGDVFVEVETGDLALGKHDVRFEYSGDEHFKASSVDGSFNVTYFRFEVPARLNPNYIGVSANTALVAMAFDATGEVKLLVDGIEKATAQIDEGSAMFWLPDYVFYGNHTVTLVYQNGNYLSTSQKFSVESLFEPEIIDISTVKVALSKTAFTYNAKVQKPTVTLTNGAVLKEGVDYTLKWSAASPKNVGTYTVTVTGIGIYKGTVKKAFKINKAANPLTVKAKSVKVKFSALKKKAQSLAVSKVVTFSKKGQGALTYAKVSGNKKITINKKTGKVTVAKGLKKGTYKVKVKIKAAGNANYKASAYKAVAFKIVVK